MSGVECRHQKRGSERRGNFRRRRARYLPMVPTPWWIRVQKSSLKSFQWVSTTKMS
jgi:hypothetical protein